MRFFDIERRVFCVSFFSLAALEFHFDSCLADSTWLTKLAKVQNEYVMATGRFLITEAYQAHLFIKTFLKDVVHFQIGSFMIFRDCS